MSQKPLYGRSNTLKNKIICKDDRQAARWKDQNTLRPKPYPANEMIFQASLNGAAIRKVAKHTTIKWGRSHLPCWMVLFFLCIYLASCLVPTSNGKYYYTSLRMEKVWDICSTFAPVRLQKWVERYKIVRKAG